MLKLLCVFKGNFSKDITLQTFSKLYNPGCILQLDVSAGSSITTPWSQWGENEHRGGRKVHILPNMTIFGGNTKLLLIFVCFGVEGIQATS